MAFDAYDVLHDLKFEDLSEQAVYFAKRAILDLVGVSFGGATTDLSRVIRNHAVHHFAAGASSSRMLCDGRRVSAVGAALAGGMTIDALDGHDGQKLTKGHVGCGVFPAVMALLDAENQVSPKELITSMVLGYEFGSRAGIALHQTAQDYHTSGAWVSVACAALGARALGLTRAQTRDAVGIAEYHGPRSQMMRCIDHPTMVKDGSGWGAMAGVSAAYLAADGFTGAPAVTIESDDVADIWSDLGSRWYVFEQYIKLFPVCRWAQPPLQAVLDLRKHHNLVSGDVERIEVTTFHEAIRLAVRDPKTTEEAQYSTAYPSAVGMVRGGVTAADVSQQAFGDAEIQRLARTMTFEESDEYNAAFPARRFAHVTLVLKNGERIASPRSEARGDPEAHLELTDIHEKFYLNANQVIGSTRAADVLKTIESLDQLPSLAKFNEMIFATVSGHPT